MDKALRKMYRVKELLPGVYGISSSAVVSYLVVGKTGAMVIDTAYGFKDMSRVVKEITSLPVTVVNTHGHLDHTGGNFFFDGPTCIHEADRELYKLHNSAQAHREMEKSLRVFQKIVFWRELLPKHPEAHDADRESFSNFHYIKEGDAFDLGGVTAKVIEIPGHTQGSVAILFPEKKLLVTSDGANPGIWLFLPESTSLEVYAKSLHKLEGLDFDKILTGHSQQLYTKDDLAKWIDVAEHPDFETAKENKPNYFAPNARPINCWSASDPKHKGPCVVIDKNRLS